MLVKLQFSVLAFTKILTIILRLKLKCLTARKKPKKRKFLNIKTLSK